MNDILPLRVTRRWWSWLLLVGLALGGGVIAWRIAPAALSLLNLDIRMDRSAAIRAARQLAADNKWGPERVTHEVAAFGQDSEVQAFVELEGGGKPAFTALINEGLYSPYSWTVRRFREGETNQTTVRFKPDGRPLGFVETVREAAPGASLAVAEARVIAETAAQTEPWRVALAQFTPVEISQIARPGGRIDHTFVYERTGRSLGEGRLRLRLVVRGDRLGELTHYVQVPEAFRRRYAQMRSVNNAVAGVASGAMAVLYLLGGCGVGLYFLLVRRALVWRPALIAAGIFAGLQALGELNAWPLVWMNYDTALTAAGFITQRQVALVAGALGMGVIYFLTFLAAESLTRTAFPAHPQFWRFWSGPAAASPPALRRTLAGYLLAPIKLGYVVVFYFAATNWLGWWTPAETLVDPNSLAHLQPWFTPVARALHAGFWEEMLFRAIPLAGAALLGEKFGRRRAWVGVALVLQAVVFAAAHANYPGQPAYSRVVELMLPSLIYGGIFLRWGLVPAILLHFVYDVVLMALPIFAASAPGLWWDRAAVALLALVPLWVVLGRRARAGATAGVPAGFWNREWVAPEPAPAAESRSPWGRTAGAVSPLAWRAGLVLAVVGAGVWAGTAGWRRFGPPLAVGRGEAERVARAALAERGVKLPPSVRVLVSVSPRPPGVDRYVWTQAGREKYAALLGSYVPVPRWQVRFVSFTGDVAERAEEWICYVGGDGRLQLVRHRLPEGRAGATLTREEGRALAHRVLRERWGYDPAGLKEVSATSGKRPKRTDWTFVFQDRAVTGIAPAEARIAIAIAGDEVTDAYRYTFLPEEWEREQRKFSSDLRVGTTVRNVLLVLGVLTGVGAAVVALSRRKFELRLALAVGGIAFGAAVLGAANRWPAALARFSTTQNYDFQLATAAAGPIVGGLVMATAFALLAGYAAHRLPPPLRDGRQAAVFGGALGWVAAGALALAGFFRERATPPWANLAGAETVFPWLGALPGAITSYVASTALLLMVFATMDRLSAGWSRRRLLVGVIGIVAASVLALGSDAPDHMTWLMAALGLGLFVTAAYVLALRQDLTLLPLTNGVLAVAGVLEGGIQRQHPAALPAALLAAVAVGTLAWWWFKALRGLAGRKPELLQNVADGASPARPIANEAGSRIEVVPPRVDPIIRPTFTAGTLAIETQALTRNFGGVRAVDGLNLAVSTGRFYGFLGPNGAGKSTTIKMLTGLLAPSSGTMRILGEDLADPERALAVKRRIGVVPENLALFDNLTGYEYLTFIGRMYGLEPDTVRTRSHELLAMMELAQEEDKLTAEYSHGMKKKLALAAALIPDPELLFLDEPFEGVDAVASRVLRHTLQQCVRRGATIFLTSHVLEIVERLCTDVGIISGGRLVHQGTMADLQRDGTLEERFIAVVGTERGEPQKLSWLES